MGNDNLKNIVFGLALFVLFSSLIIFLAVNLGENYGKSAEEIGGGSLNLTLFSHTVENVTESSEHLRERFDDSNVEDVESAIGVFSIFNDVGNMITTPFKLISQVAENILGVPPVVTTIALGLLSLSILLGVWSLVKKGD